MSHTSNWSNMSEPLGRSLRPVGDDGVGFGVFIVELSNAWVCCISNFLKQLYASAPS
jgi:hypothetical protein